VVLVALKCSQLLFIVALHRNFIIKSFLSREQVIFSHFALKIKEIIFKPFEMTRHILTSNILLLFLLLVFVYPKNTNGLVIYPLSPLSSPNESIWNPDFKSKEDSLWVKFNLKEKLSFEVHLARNLQQLEQIYRFSVQFISAENAVFCLANTKNCSNVAISKSENRFWVAYFHPQGRIFAGVGDVVGDQKKFEMFLPKDQMIPVNNFAIAPLGNQILVVDTLDFGMYIKTVQKVRVDSGLWILTENSKIGVEEDRIELTDASNWKRGTARFSFDYLQLSSRVNSSAIVSFDFDLNLSHPNFSSTNDPFNTLIADGLSVNFANYQCMSWGYEGDLEFCAPNASCFSITTFEAARPSRGIRLGDVSQNDVDSDLGLAPISKLWGKNRYSIVFSELNNEDSFRATSVHTESSQSSLLNHRISAKSLNLSDPLSCIIFAARTGERSSSHVIEKVSYSVYFPARVPQEAERKETAAIVTAVSTISTVLTSTTVAAGTVVIALQASQSAGTLTATGTSGTHLADPYIWNMISFCQQSVLLGMVSSIPEALREYLTSYAFTMGIIPFPLLNNNLKYTGLFKSSEINDFEENFADGISQYLMLLRISPRTLFFTVFICFLLAYVVLHVALVLIKHSVLLLMKFKKKPPKYINYVFDNFMISGSIRLGLISVTIFCVASFFQWKTGGHFFLVFLTFVALCSVLFFGLYMPFYVQKNDTEHPNKLFKSKFGAYYIDMKPGISSYNAFENLIKIIIAAVLIFTIPEPAIQVSVLLLLNCIVFGACLYLRPFVHKSKLIVHLALTFLNMLQVFIAMCYVLGWNSPWLGSVAIVVNFVTVLCYFLLMIKNIFKSFQRSFKQIFKSNKKLVSMESGSSGNKTSHSKQPSITVDSELVNPTIPSSMLRMEYSVANLAEELKKEKSIRISARARNTSDATPYYDHPSKEKPLELSALPRVSNIIPKTPERTGELDEEEEIVSGIPKSSFIMYQNEHMEQVVEENSYLAEENEAQNNEDHIQEDEAEKSDKSKKT
jgi:hypothetical protein